MPKKRIINVRNGVIAGTIIASVIVGGLSLKKYNRSLIDMKIAISLEKNMLGYNGFDIVFDDDLRHQDGYKVGDITVISIFNPLKNKTEYYFMQLCTCNNCFSKDSFLNSFRNTSLEEQISSDKAKCEGENYVYLSIFDDDAKYSFCGRHATGEDVSGSRCSGIFMLPDLNVSVLSSFVYDDNRGVELLENKVFAVDENKNVYSDLDISDINILLLQDVTNISPDNVLTKEELKDLFDSLNNSCNLGKN